MKLTVSQREICDSVLSSLQQDASPNGARVSHFKIIRAYGGGGLTTCVNSIVQRLNCRSLIVAPDYLSSTCIFHELFYQALGLRPEVKSYLHLAPPFLVDFIRLRRIRVVLLEDAHFFHEGQDKPYQRLMSEFNHVMAMLPEVDFIVSEAFPHISEWQSEIQTSHAREIIQLQPFSDLKEYMAFVRDLVENADNPRVSVDQLDARYAIDLLALTGGNLDLTVSYLTFPFYELR
ncbi:hypothetical protein F3J44_21140 [Pantoea sp. Tr-811]|uniref:hypothetical protein n=1 Tax=Pantoea sp. Tr-811 TaxID=2608361 RepID=UPI001421ED00|nr:hypothetical protein [Pantoea sp. Tr-811]NIF28873.1 hypothetical protein [Pantoea sp. Tr-811]